jgi:hypothetical protein
MAAIIFPEKFWPIQIKVDEYRTREDGVNAIKLKANFGAAN